MANVNVELLCDLTKIPVPDDGGATARSLESTAGYAAAIAGAAFDPAASLPLTDLQNVYREDVVIPSTPRERLLQNAGGGEDGFFLVRRKEG